MSPSFTHTFSIDELLPACWRTKQEDAARTRIFNPAIAELPGGDLVLAYRAVLADGLRRLAICRLDASYAVQSGSVVALSNHITGADDWQADARFFVFGNRLLLHFNNGFRKPNQIFVVELDPDTLVPKAPAKPLRLAGSRQAVEKNWQLFARGGQIYATYSIAPHVILRVEETADAFECTRCDTHEWNASAYATRFGTPRGGTPPVLHGDIYHAFFHSTYPLPRWQRILHRALYGRGVRVRQYAAGFYAFASTPPFNVLRYTPTPILLAGKPPEERRLNRAVERVVYPCGAIFRENHWVVSYGLNDEKACLGIFSHADLAATARPVVQVNP